MLSMHNQQLFYRLLLTKKSSSKNTLLYDVKILYLTKKSNKSKTRKELFLTHDNRIFVKRHVKISQVKIPEKKN